MTGCAPAFSMPPLQSLGTLVHLARTNCTYGDLANLHKVGGKKENRKEKKRKEWKASPVETREGNSV